MIAPKPPGHPAASAPALRSGARTGSTDRAGSAHAITTGTSRSMRTTTAYPNPDVLDEPARGSVHPRHRPGDASVLAGATGQRDRLHHTRRDVRDRRSRRVLASGRREAPRAWHRAHQHARDGDAIHFDGHPGSIDYTFAAPPGAVGSRPSSPAPPGFTACCLPPTAGVPASSPRRAPHNPRARARRPPRRR